MKIPLLLLLTQITISAKSQDTTGRSKPVQKSYPVFKYLSIQKDYFSDSDYKLHAKDGSVQEQGEFSSERLRVSAFIPVYSKNSLSVSAGVVYTRQSMTYFNQLQPDPVMYQKAKLATNDVDGLFSFVYKGMLFNRPIINNVTLITGSTNFFDIKKVSGLLSSTMIMKMSASTVSSLGLILNVDKSSIFPVFPVFSYWHRFSGSLWEMDFLLPQKMMFRRSGVLDGWLSTGVELNGSSFFTKQGAEGSYRAGNYEWVSTEVYSNIGYEYLLGENFLFGIKGGYRNAITTRLVKVNDSANDYKSRTKLGSLFFNFNMSFVLANSKLKNGKARKK